MTALPLLWQRARDMGFLLWGALTALCWTSGWAVAIRFRDRSSVGEMLSGACITAVALVLGVLQALGYAGVLYPWTAALAVCVASGGILAWARPSRVAVAETWARFREAARSAVWAPGSALITALALVMVLFLALYAVLLPSWAWDAMWYHDAISAYAYQTHSLGWVATWIPFVNSYPKGVELLSLWNVLFAPDDRLLDAAQLPLLLMGCAALASVARRTGARPALAWGLGLTFLLIPAVFLNTPTNYNDVGAASLWLVAVLFLARLDATGPHRLFGALALGATACAKVSGLLYVLLLAPVILLALALEWRRTRQTRTLLLQTAGAAAAIFALGGATYVRDLVKFGNPFWPAQVPIPLLGKSFPGTWKLSDFNTPPFGGPDDLAAMWRSFTTAHPAWQVDVRLGGFGSLWVDLLLPLCAVALAIAAVRLARKKPTPGALAMIVLGVTALATPARWWPRYTLGLPAAGILGAAIVLRLLPRPWLRQLALVGVGVWAAVQAWPARTGFFAPRDHDTAPWQQLIKAWHLPPAQRAALHFDNWQQPGIALRDQVVKPGEASAYDRSTSFVYQLWRRDWKNRVLYLPLQDGGDPQAWLSELAAQHVRWASFGRGSLAERTLRAAGWRFLWPCGAEGCDVWVKPGTAIPGAAPGSPAAAQ